jgi:hypothetical protein
MQMAAKSGKMGFTAATEPAHTIERWRKMQFTASAQTDHTHSIDCTYLGCGK